MRRLYVCLGLVLPWVATASASPPDALNVSLDARASLYYYLECSTGGLSCSKDDVDQLLGDVLGVEVAGRLTAEWAATVGGFGAQELPQPPATEWPDLGPDPAATNNVRARVQDVLFDVGAPGSAQERLAAVTNPANARAIAAIVDSAWPAYSRWWSQHESDWRGYGALLGRILRSEGSTTVLATERMFGVANEVRLAVLPVPLPMTGPVNRASQKGRHSFVEFRPDDDPAARVAVIIHEYCHYLLRAAPQRLHRARMDAFAAAQEPSAAAAFAVMNEALASAIGNGLFMKAHLDAAHFEAYASRSSSFYADPVIDRTAKATLALVERYADAGVELDRTFFAEYFRQTQVTLADVAADPRVSLGVSQFYYMQDALESLVIDASNRYRFTSVYYNRWDPERFSETMGYRFADVSVAIVGTEADSLPALQRLVGAAQLPSLDGMRATSCRARRPRGGWVFLFVVTPAQTTLEIPEKVAVCSQ